VDLDLFGRFDANVSFRKILLDAGRRVEGSEMGEVQSLVVDGYFQDAEDDPMPKMFLAMDWEEVKSRIMAAVKAFVVQDVGIGIP